MKRLKVLFAACLLGAASLASARTIEMDVNGLVCAFCAQGIEKTMKKFPATSAVLVSLEHRIVAVQLKPGEDIADPLLTRAITDAGYTLVRIRRTDTPLSDLRKRLGDEPSAPDPHDHGKSDAAGK